MFRSFEDASTESFQRTVTESTEGGQTIRRPHRLSFTLPAVTKDSGSRPSYKSTTLGFFFKFYQKRTHKNEPREPSPLQLPFPKRTHLCSIGQTQAVTFTLNRLAMWPHLCTGLPITHNHHHHAASLRDNPFLPLVLALPGLSAQFENYS